MKFAMAMDSATPIFSFLWGRRFEGEKCSYNEKHNDKSSTSSKFEFAA